MKFGGVCNEPGLEERAVKSLSQGHNRITRVGLKRDYFDHVRHQYGALTHLITLSSNTAFTDDNIFTTANQIQDFSACNRKKAFLSYLLNSWKVF